MIQQDITPKMIKQADTNISNLLNPKKESIYCECSIYLSGRNGCYFCNKPMKPIKLK
jgi:hypothetical protein